MTRTTEKTETMYHTLHGMFRAGGILFGYRYLCPVPPISGFPSPPIILYVRAPVYPNAREDIVGLSARSRQGLTRDTIRRGHILHGSMDNCVHLRKVGTPVSLY